MSTPTTSAMRLTTAIITQYLSARKSLAASLTGSGQRRVVLLRSVPMWDGPAEPSWGEDRRARVVAAPSPLSVHELVLGHLAGDEDPQVLVVLTDREESELDSAILARTHKRRIQTVDGWDVVREVFGAEQVELRLRELGWAAEALLDATPPGGWPRLAGGVLSRRAALTELALRRLAIGRYGEDSSRRAEGLDAHSLLRWSLDPGGPERLRELRTPEQHGLTSFLAEEDQAGMAGRALLALVHAGQAADAVPFGLICAALWRHAGASKATYQARGRAEGWFGDPRPAVGDALDAMLTAFGRACEEYVVALLERADESRDEEAAQQARRLSSTVLNRAGFLTRQFSAEDAMVVSPVVEAGLEARFAAVGHALAISDLRGVTRAVHDLRDHRLAATEHARIERVCMAQRLTQWLAGDPQVESATVAAGIQRQIAETGWADRALEYLEAGGDSDPGLRAAYDALGKRVRERRRRIDRAFARRLATWTASGTDPGSMLTVETFLRRVVPPVLKNGIQRRVLLLVLDGMSAAVACELAEEITKTWEEYDPLPDGGPPGRRAMAAALPTLTAVSRTSLFAGALLMGGQPEEERLFPGHRFWGSAKAAAFHKDDLRSDTTGDAYSPALTEALADGQTHIAVVLNTIDDRLGKELKLGDGAWRLAEIGKLQDLMRTAANQGMAMIITSDHGHVVDRHGRKVDAATPGSARHRETGGPLTDSELALTGPRVVWPEPGGSIVALWDADSRYTAQKAGYHGGASPAEFAIPVLAFLPYGATPPKAWRAIGGQAPLWWAVDETAVQLATLPAPQQKGRGRGRRVPDQETALFEVASPVEASRQRPREEVLVGALLAAEAFQAQLGLLTRKPATETVERALIALLSAGTLPVAALAQQAGLAASRADGFAAVLRRLLNFDGVQVLETLPDGRTLRLDIGLLREQFELGGADQ